MRVVAAREPRKVELFDIKIHLKPMLFGCSPSWFYFTSWFRLYQLRCYTSIRTHKNFWPPKVAPDCRLRELRHSLSNWRCMARSPMKRFWLGILDGPVLPRFSDATANSASCFGCCKKKPLDHGYITRPSADIYDSMIALGFYSRCRSQWPFNGWGCGVPAIFS